MENIESRTPGSWLADNLKDMDQSVKRMVKLIEEDGSATSDGATCQSKPDLIANIEHFHQLYRSLAERYDHMAKEQRDSESGYDQEASLKTPDVKVLVHKSGDQSVGLDTSPSSPGADSVFSLKEGSESASLSSASDSDSESFVTSYLRTPLSINSQSLHQKLAELEGELSAAKEKLRTRDADLDLEKERAFELQKRVVELEARVSDMESKSGILVEELEVARNSLLGSNEEISKLKQELNDRASEGHLLQNQLELAQGERANFEALLASEKELVLELEEMISRYNADLSDRDLEVWELKVALRDAEELYFQEKSRLQTDVQSLSEKQAQSELKIKELEEKTIASEIEKMEMHRFYDAQTTALQDESNQLKIELGAHSAHIEALNKDFDECKLKYDILMAERDNMRAEIDNLVANLSARDNQIREMERQMSQLGEQHDKLVDELQKARELVDELKPRVEELQNEVARQGVMISDGAEEKREVIRQLCFSLEHYRSGYQELRQAFVGNRRNVVMAA